MSSGIPNGKSSSTTRSLSNNLPRMPTAKGGALHRHRADRPVRALASGRSQSGCRPTTLRRFGPPRATARTEHRSEVRGRFMFSGPQAGQFAAFPGHTIARKTPGRDSGRLSRICNGTRRRARIGRDSALKIWPIAQNALSLSCLNPFRAAGRKCAGHTEASTDRCRSG